MKEDELNLLLYMLTLDTENDFTNNINKTEFNNNIAKEKYKVHQIGYGKNYGFGAVKFKIDKLNLFSLNENNNINCNEKDKEFIKKKLENAKNTFQNILSYPEINNIVTLKDSILEYPQKVPDSIQKKVYNNNKELTQFYNINYKKCILKREYKFNLSYAKRNQIINELKKANYKNSFIVNWHSDIKSKNLKWRKLGQLLVVRD